MCVSGTGPQLREKKGYETRNGLERQAAGPSRDQLCRALDVMDAVKLRGPAGLRV